MRVKINPYPAQSMKMVYILIALNVAVYLLIPRTSELYRTMALTPEQVFHGAIWQLLTHSFLHADFFHILFNMWGLYLFGSFVCNFLRPMQIINLYGLCALGGALLQMATSGSPMVGASGAVCGFTVAAAMIVPDLKIQLLFLPVPMKMKTFFWVFVGMEFLLNGTNDQIAHMAHIGGVIAGYFYLLSIKTYTWNPLNFLFRSRDIDFDSYKEPEQDESFKKVDFSPKELDRILDKMGRTGVNSLTEEEFNCLKQAREIYKKK